MNHPLSSFLVSLGSAALVCLNLQAATPQRLVVEKPAEPLIPISLSGYSGEVDAVLKYDLDVAGFEIVAPDAARFSVAGNNASAVEGQLIERVTKVVVADNRQSSGGQPVVLLENRRYSGGTLRWQAHAFSDDIVLKVTGKPGIARTRIAFKGESGGSTEIYVADYDGANALAVTRDKVLVAAPCWFPGQRILFYTSYKSGFADVYSQNLATGERRVIAKYPGLNSSAAVSSHGRVALILSKSGSPDLYVCDADGGNLKQLTKTKEDESSPCWSPDGKTICFCSRTGGSPALYTIAADGGSPKRLRAVGAGSSLTEPDWSPDGEWIAYTVLRGSGFELQMVPAAGGEITVLTSGSDPSWAANSRTLIFTRQERGRKILSLLDVKTKRFKDVAQNLGSCSQPSWAK
jgi:TolB protein